MWHPESKNCRKCGPLKKGKIVGNVDPEEVGNVGTPLNYWPLSAAYLQSISRPK